MKKHNIRHVSVTYWTNVSKPQIMVYDEDKDGNSPEGHEGRRYQKPSNRAMLKLTSVIDRHGVKPHLSWGMKMSPSSSG